MEIDTLKTNIAYLSVILVAMLLMAACGSAATTGVSPEAQATIDALAAEVETLKTEVTTLQSAASAATGQVDDVGMAIVAEDAPAAPESPLSSSAAVAVVEEVATAEPEVVPTDTPTPPPPPTPLPTFEPAPLDGEPPADRYRPEGRIGDFWTSDDDRQQSLGWALERTLQPGDGVVQNFEHGLMLWRSDTGQILALWTEDGARHWRVVDDTFEEGEMEKDPAISAPSGMRQPERGFGKVWRTYPDLREQLGWALEKEQKTGVRIQAFERGQVTELGLRTYAIGQTPDGQTIWDME